MDRFEARVDARFEKMEGRFDKIDERFAWLWRLKHGGDVAAVLAIVLA